jgi:hypothetical protein
MYLDNDPEKKPVKLESGDRCVWYIHDGTIKFMRGEIRLKHNGDDKFFIGEVNFPILHEIMNVLAETHNLSMEIDKEDKRNGVIIYRFR